MSKTSRLSTGLTGIAGEYFVGAELSRHGYVASITLRNTRGIDILASNADATKSVGIQVKTNQGHGKKWILNEKIEKDIATNLFFVFVCLNGLDAPEYHIVPRADVVKYVSEDHKQWLSKPGRKGQAHKDAPSRQGWTKAHSASAPVAASGAHSTTRPSVWGANSGLPSRAYTGPG